MRNRVLSRVLNVNPLRMSAMILLQSERNRPHRSRRQLASDRVEEADEIKLAAEYSFKPRKRRRGRRKEMLPTIKRTTSRRGPSSERSFTLLLLTVLLFVASHCSMRTGPWPIGRVACEETTGDAGGPVKITVQPNDLIAIEGESSELNCDAEGDPEPVIEWYHNGQLIRSSTNTRTTMGGSIQFLDVRPNVGPEDAGQQQQQSDAGVYYCLAKNQFGQARSRNATLQVACKYRGDCFNLANQ
jgi:hypothetical protein